jgi:hypothetical protein
LRHERNRATELFERFVSGGEAVIDQFIAEQISEELFVDYKRVTNEGASPKLEQSDRENFARAISGFGNSEGGIIVWGVDCRDDRERGDVPTTKYPIQNVKRFLSYLEGATSGCTLPPHDEVRHHLIKRRDPAKGSSSHSSQKVCLPLTNALSGNIRVATISVSALTSNKLLMASSLGCLERDQRLTFFMCGSLAGESRPRVMPLS